MSVKQKVRHVLAELRGHVPFTACGAVLGIFFMLLFAKVVRMKGYTLFVVFHPAHVILSAMVTASMFKLHAVKKSLLLVVFVGYFGSIGVATLSDIIIPHIGGHLLGLDIPAHAALHSDETGSEEETGEGTDGQGHADPGRHIHLGFIEEWYIVNPAALLGIVIAYLFPRTKFPHAGHILVSTWASSSYLLMKMQPSVTAGAAAGIFATLFLSVWVPCCVSDIVFPLLFVKSDLELATACPHHRLHSHPHLPQSEQSQ